MVPHQRVCGLHWVLVAMAAGAVTAAAVPLVVTVGPRTGNLLPRHRMCATLAVLLALLLALLLPAVVVAAVDGVPTRGTCRLAGATGLHSGSGQTMGTTTTAEANTTTMGNTTTAEANTTTMGNTTTAEANTIAAKQ